MGTLRGGQDAAFFQKIAAEVTDLFGTADCTLFRYSAAADANIAIKDPVWDEPSTTPVYTTFKMPCNWFNWETAADPTEMGKDVNIDATAYLALNHLIGAGVPKDEKNDYVESGDILSIHDMCGHDKFVYDVIQASRTGWVNSSDQYTGYELQLKRRDKYVPERKTQDD